MRLTIALLSVLLSAGPLRAADGAAPETVGPNLVQNPGFEQGDAGWNRGLGTVEDPVFEGKKACVLEATAEKAGAIVQPFVAIRPRTDYRFSIAVRRTTGEGYLYVHCNWYEAPGKPLMSSKNWNAGRAMPVTLRTGEGVGRWQVHSGTFRSDRRELGGVQLVVLVRGGRDTVYLDDVKIEEVRYPDAPPWDLARDVVLPGGPARFHMRVEDARQQDGAFVVRTTGAEFRLDPAAGTLLCRQRIGKEREVAAVRFSERLEGLAIVRKDDDVCTIAEAHRLGMQVICYRHPTSYVWAGVPLDDAIADMRRFRREYGFDGWYFDGLYYAGEWTETYRFIRAMRESVGPEGVIYTHCTLNPPSRMCDLYCPFIDAYSDFLLRGEAQTIYGPKDPYLRYVVGTYKISNAIATLKGDKMLADGAEEPAPPPGARWTPEESRAAWAKVHYPLRGQLEVMLRLNGRCRWAYPAWPLGRSDREDYLGFYFPELDRMQAEWEKTGQAPPMRWP